MTYQNERVLDVRPVSDEPESYFRTQNNMEAIRKEIEKAGDSTTAASDSGQENRETQGETERSLISAE